MRAESIGKLRTTLAATSNRSTLRRDMLQLLVIAKILSSGPIIFNLIIGAVSSSETSVVTGAKRRNIPEESILLNLNYV
jgi:hypothetical protein